MGVVAFCGLGPETLQKDERSGSQQGEAATRKQLNQDGMSPSDAELAGSLFLGLSL